MAGSSVERTRAGWQYVLPGAERRTARGTVYAAEESGQLLLREMQPVTQGDRLRHRLAAPLKPRVGQKPPPAGGLFRR